MADHHAQNMTIDEMTEDFAVNATDTGESQRPEPIEESFEQLAQQLQDISSEVDEAVPTESPSEKDQENSLTGRADTAESNSTPSQPVQLSSDSEADTDDDLDWDLASAADSLLDGDIGTIDEALKQEQSVDQQPSTDISDTNNATDTATENQQSESPQDVTAVQDEKKTSQADKANLVEDSKKENQTEAAAAMTNFQNQQRLVSGDEHREEASSPCEQPSHSQVENPTTHESGKTGTGWVSNLKQVVIQILFMINFPLRFLPLSKRMVVDWMILGLVFWIPIVWAYALFW